MSEITRYDVEIPVPGLGQYTLCVCYTPEAAVAIMESLLTASEPSYDRVTVAISRAPEPREAELHSAF